MNWFKSTPKRIYLDYAAATPVAKEVIAEMSKYWRESFANAGSIHQEGVLAKQAIDSAREKVARTLRVRATDIIFTSGGTESNNLAIRGAVKGMMDSGVKADDIEIISTRTEHPSISKVLGELQKLGIHIKYISVGEDGLINFDEFQKSLSFKTRLVTIAYANSEVGVVQDLGKISRAIKSFEKKNGLQIYFHTDASQAPMWLPCALDALGVDMLTLEAGKCEGPKGVGVLVKRPRVFIKSVSFGGSQEDGLRPGTEPVSLIVGAAKAIELAQTDFLARSQKVTTIRNKWVKQLRTLPVVLINGDIDNRLPNNVNISIPKFDTEFAVIYLDKAGIAASTKSACSGAGSGKSTVVYEMTKDIDRASATIRFTLSPTTSLGELSQVTQVLKSYLAKMASFNDVK